MKLGFRNVCKFIKNETLVFCVTAQNMQQLKMSKYC